MKLLRKKIEKPNGKLRQQSPKLQEASEVTRACHNLKMEMRLKKQETVETLKSP